MVLALLNIPQDGVFGVNAALLFAREQEMCAYWWREQNGRQQATFVSPQTVKAALGSIPIDSGYLPQGTLRVGITRQGANWMAVYIPRRAYQLTIERDDRSQHTIELGLPGCVLMGVADHYWVWAAKEQEVSGETRLYHLPVPNVGGDGTMCYGETHPPKVSGSHILPAFFLFMNSPFSDHWATGKSQMHPGDIRERLFTLAARTPAVFPEEDLVPLQYARQPGEVVTLDALMKLILGGSMV